MELVTKKKLMLYTGDSHPALAQEIADDLQAALAQIQDILGDLQQRARSA